MLICVCLYVDKQLVSRGKPVLMFVILVTFVHCLFKSEPLGAT
jgi:hypothetical protein